MSSMGEREIYVYVNQNLDNIYFSSTHTNVFLNQRTNHYYQVAEWYRVRQTILLFFNIFMSLYIQFHLILMAYDCLRFVNGLYEDPWKHLSIAWYLFFLKISIIIWIWQCIRHINNASYVFICYSNLIYQWFMVPIYIYRLKPIRLLFCLYIRTSISLFM